MVRFSALATPQWYLEGAMSYGVKGFQKASASFVDDALAVSLEGKVACVTGANSGIGYCVAKSLAEKNATVHMICRNQARGVEAKNRMLEETGNDDVHLHVVDVSDFRQVEAFAAEFVATNPRLNILVNNAGGMPSARTLSPQGNESIMATMLGGSYLLTKLLLPALENAAAAEGEGQSGTVRGAARVINVSSGGMYAVSATGVAEDLNSLKVDPYDGTLIYAAAKRVQVILTEMWAVRKNPNTGNGLVTFNSMHPGWVDTPGLSTGMPSFRESRGASLRSSEQGGDTITWLACSEAAAGETGKFWFDRKARRTHMPLAGTRESESERGALWDAVEKYCASTSS